MTTPADDKADQPVVLAQYDNKDKNRELYRFELGPALGTGEGVADAQMVLNPSTGEPYVQLSFKDGEKGIDAWRAAAKECYNGTSLCPTRQLAIAGGTGRSEAEWHALAATAGMIWRESGRLKRTVNVPSGRSWTCSPCKVTWALGSVVP